jgi:hypothetical protein
MENFERRRNIMDGSSEEYESMNRRPGNYLEPKHLYWKLNRMPIEKRVTFKRWNSQGILRKGQGGDGWKSWGDSWKIQN